MSTTIKQYAEHPLAAELPLMDKDSFAQLVKSIKEQGQQEDIILFEGKILDGRNRYKACKEIGIEPHCREYTGDTPVEYVFTHNVTRRHLTPSQSAAMAVAFLPKLEEEAKRRQSTGKSAPTENKGKATAAAAKMAGVSTRQVQTAKALKKASPKLFKKVKAGKVTLNAAVKAAPKAAKTVKESKPLPKEDYDASVKRLGKLCGMAFADGIINRKWLKERADVVKLAKAKDNDIMRVKPLLEIGWELGKAFRYKPGILTENSRISELTALTVFSGKKDVTLPGFVITVNRK